MQAGINSLLHDEKIPIPAINKYNQLYFFSSNSPYRGTCSHGPMAELSLYNEIVGPMVALEASCETQLQLHNKISQPREQ